MLNFFLKCESRVRPNRVLMHRRMFEEIEEVKGTMNAGMV